MLLSVIECRLKPRFYDLATVELLPKHIIDFGRRISIIRRVLNKNLCFYIYIYSLRVKMLLIRNGRRDGTEFVDDGQ